MFCRKKIYLTFCIASLLALIFAFCASASSTVISNVFSVTEPKKLSDIDMYTLVPYDSSNWVLSDGSAPQKRYEPGLAGYVYGDTAYRSISSFSSSLSAPIDAYSHRQISFVLFIEGEDGLKKNADISVTLTVESDTESLVCKGSVSGSGTKLITFDIGFWKYRKNITSIKLRLDGDGHRPSYFRAEISGPYVKKPSKINMEKFMSYGLYASGSELEVVNRGKANEALRVYLGAGRVNISGTAAVPFSNEDMNAVRIVLQSDAEFDSMQFSYTYLDISQGKYLSKTVNVPFERGEKSFPYVIFTEEASLISSFTLVFDSSDKGSVNIYSIEPVAVYKGSTEEAFGELSKAKFDKSKKTLSLSGNVHHGYLVSHDNYELLCYMISSTESFEAALSDGAQPLATAKMSSKFNFELKLDGSAELAHISKYAVASRSPSGEITLLAPPVSVDGDFSVADTSMGRTNIKGLDSPRLSENINSGTGTAIIDVYIDKLVNSTHGGHLYTVDDCFIYFSAEYLSELDRKIKNLSASGCKVYMRLLISADADLSVLPYAENEGSGSEAQFLAVNLQDKNSEKHFFGVVDFLAGRYSTSQNGKIHGMILGRSLDRPNEYNYSPSSGIVSYSVMTARAFELMARAASDSIPGIEVVLPISDKTDNSVCYDTELFLTSVAAYLEESGGLQYSIMLESSIVNDYSSENINTLERFMEHLSRSFEYAPSSYIYYWSPDLSLLRDDLYHAYIYNYYRIMFSDKASSFVIALPDGEQGRNAFDSISHLIKYIDTAKNKDGSLTDPSALYFGAEGWEELIPRYDKALILYRVLNEVNSTEALHSKIKGSYALWDFSTAFGILDWFEGNGCSSVYLDSTSQSFRALCARLSFTDGKNEFSDIVYSFSYPENISLMPYISFEITIEGGSEGDVYPVMITIGDTENRLETSALVSNGENATVIVNTTALKEMKSAEYIRIGVRPSDESESTEGLRLYLKKVEAHSEKYDSDELASAIKSSRADSKSTFTSYEDETAERNYAPVITILLIILLSVFLIGVFEKRNKA